MKTSDQDRNTGPQYRRRPPTPGEVERQREAVKKLEDMEHSPGSLPTGPAGRDGPRGGAIDVNGGGASPKETPADHGRQGPQKGVSEGWSVEEALEVLARDSSPL